MDTINTMFENTGVTASLVNVNGSNYLKFTATDATRWGVDTGNWPIFAVSADNLDDAAHEGCALLAMSMAVSGLAYSDIGAIFDPMAHLEAKFLGSSETSPNDADYHFSGELGRFQKLTVHTSPPDYFIASRFFGSEWTGEESVLEQAVCPDWASVVRFFGNHPLAKRLLTEVKPDDMAANDGLDESPVTGTPSATITP